MFIPRFVLVTLAALLLFTGFAAVGNAQEATPGSAELTVLAPDESYAGLTRGEWDARWWQWATSMPEEINPNFDPTGERCGYGQFGPVFFTPAGLAPSPDDGAAPIRCVVPEGTGLFVSLGGTECSTVEPPPYFGRNEAELRECAALQSDTFTSVEATVNGVDLPDIERYRTDSPLFTLNFPEDNFFGVPEGAALSVSNGYSLLIAPPPPGEYDLTFSTVSEGSPDRSTFSLTVVVIAAEIIEPEATPDATPDATPEA